ncbi:MAG TPA: murein biosynthesis integral membrane protein MurJ, partial [Acetobacteraceae bacterium]|nr:murein biosynthesis integral membrane protein MurJ [Acetobacteraceae bacterium]
MLRGIVTVGGWTAASRVAGFVRDILIAALAGTGPVADAFFVALRVPNLFRRLFGEGAFNAAFVPEFSGILATEGTQAAKRFAEQAIAVLAFWLLLLTVLGEIFMPQLMRLLAPGFMAIPGKAELTVALARITFPYVFLICLAALLSGVLNGLDRFAAAAAAPLLFNTVSIGAMLLLTPWVPTVGHALAWGVTISGVLQLALLAWAVRRAGMALHIPRPRLTPQMRVLLARMGPGLLGAGVTQLNLAVDVIIVSLLPPGSASLLYYADRVNQLPLGVIGTAVGTAILPLLSRQARAGEAREAIQTLNRALELSLVLTLPAALGLAVAGFPIMLVLFGRGAFDATAAELSAQSLAAYAFGLPAFVVVKVLVPAFFAHGDTSTPVRVGFAAIGLNLALNLLFMVPLQHMGPALATSLSALFNVIMLGILLSRRGLLRMDRRLVSGLARM